MVTGSLCAVDGCRSSKRRDTNLSFFTLPAKEASRNAWLELIGRPDLARPETRFRSHFVCSLHFDSSDIKYTPLLLPNTLPTRLLPSSERPQRTVTVTKTRSKATLTSTATRSVSKRKASRNKSKSKRKTSKEKLKGNADEDVVNVPEEASRETSPDVEAFQIKIAEVVGNYHFSEDTSKEGRADDEAPEAQSKDETIKSGDLIEMSTELKARLEEIEMGKQIIANQEIVTKKQKERIEELELRNYKLTRRNLSLKGSVKRLNYRCHTTNKRK